MVVKRIIPVTVLIYVGFFIGHGRADAAPIVTGLYSFTGTTDGTAPEAGLIQGTDGYLYGTTLLGGNSGNGTVFRIDTNGNLTTLYRFNAFGTDGSEPQA